MAKTGKRLIEVEDGGGDKLTFNQFDNGMLLHPDIFKDMDFDALKTFTFRDDDIVIVSYLRSGSHWLWEQLKMLTGGTTDIAGSDNKESGLLEYNPIEKIAALPSPRILSNHLRFRHFPEDLRQKKPKMVFIYRNPKDVAASYFLLQTRLSWFGYNGKFENWLNLFMDGKVDWGSYADFLNDWARTIEENPELPVHILTYERLKENPIEELGRLSRFLGLDCDVSFLQAVTDKCSINKMRDRKGQFWTEQGQPEDLMYRKGIVGDWKNMFTVAQNEQFDQYWSQAFTSSNIFPMPGQV